VNAVVGGFSRLPGTAELAALEAALEAGRRDAREAVAFLAGLPPADFGGGETVYAALEPAAGYGYRGGRDVVFQVGGERRRVPLERLTEESEERPVPHSHAKHSRYEGLPFMVGALARVTLFGDRLNAPAREAAEALGLVTGPVVPSRNPLDNNAAQAVELVHDLEEAHRAVRQLLAEGPDDGSEDAATKRVAPRAGTGTAVIEAPRGLLLHRYDFDAQGRVLRANVVTPTAANAASVEERFRQVVERDPGAGDDELRHRLERVARAYDPCISCSVHLVRQAGTAG
jgi:sulfhydrogenase subunit alpha